MPYYYTGEVVESIWPGMNGPPPELDGELPPDTGPRVAATGLDGEIVPGGLREAKPPFEGEDADELNEAYLNGQHPRHLEAVEKATAIFQERHAESAEPDLLGNIPQSETLTAEQAEAMLSAKDRRYAEEAVEAIGRDKLRDHFKRRRAVANDPESYRTLARIGKVAREYPVMYALRDVAGMTREDAAREIKNRLHVDEKFQQAYGDKGHPMHKEAVAEMTALHLVASGETEMFRTDGDAA